MEVKITSKKAIPKFWLNECPVCDSKDIHEVFEPLTLTYKTETMTVEKFRSFKCDSCQESFADRDMWGYLEPQIREMHRRADEKELL